MASQTAMLNVRIDGKTKMEASIALQSMGISISDAVRLFLTRVVADQAIPFDIKVPAPDAMAQSDITLPKKLYDN